MKKKLIFIIGTILIIIITILLLWYNGVIIFNYPSEKRYEVRGVDVSSYQGDINWNVLAKQGISFAFIKATEGSDDVDAKFKRNWQLAKKAGMPRGAYHFFNAYRSGKEQAANFIETVNLSAGDLPPVLDVELSGGIAKELLQQRVSEWLAVVEAHYKIKPIIYTGANFYTNFLGEKFDLYPLWVAHYLVKDKPRINRNWTFWQHNEAGHVNGIDAFVDFNVFNGDSTDFKKLLIK